jgi:hypothetical protein
MHETQTRVGDELPNSDSLTFAELMTMAERELGAFISAVTELFGSEQAKLARMVKKSKRSTARVK